MCFTIYNTMDFIEFINSGKSVPDGLPLVLDLSFDGVESGDVWDIAEILESGKCPEGLQIDLKDNAIGSAGAGVIADALKSGQCPKGLVIVLSDAGIHSAGAEKIVDALKSGRCPEGLEITLSHNGITWEGAKAFAEVLKSGRCPYGFRIYLSNYWMRDYNLDDLMKQNDEAHIKEVYTVYCSLFNFTPFPRAINASIIFPYAYGSKLVQDILERDLKQHTSEPTVPDKKDELEHKANQAEPNRQLSRRCIM